MSMKVDVEMKNGAVCRMARQAFNVFLSMDRVVRFRRSEGWVVVGTDPLRDPEKDNDYPALADRRSTV